MRTNLIASLLLLDAMVARKVGRIVFISSGGAVYGSPNHLPVNEGHRTTPEVSYSIVKLAIDRCRSSSAWRGPSSG